MKITYYGHSCFCITTKQGVNIITDPYRGVGYELPKGLQADIVTVSHGHFDHNFTQAIKGKKEIVDKVGEYSFKDFEIIAMESFHDEKLGALRGKNLIFTIIAEELRVCHLGDIGESCHEEILKKIGKVDILLLPVGGTYTINADQAKTYVDYIRPKLAIPMHYRPIDGTIDINSADLFLEKTATEKGKSCFEIVVTKEDLVSDTTKIVFMERKI